MMVCAPTFTEDVFATLFPLFSEFPHMKTPCLDFELLSAWSIIIPKERIAYYIEDGNDTVQESEHPFAAKKKDWNIYRINRNECKKMSTEELANQIKEHVLFRKKIKKQKNFSSVLFSRIFM